jgi:hypothetical protein
MLRQAAKTLQKLAWAPGVLTTDPVYRAYLDVAWAIPDFDYVFKPEVRDCEDAPRL